jgi:hypothetical protein
MLSQILNEFQQNPGLCLDELSQKLAVEAGALEGMLQTLVRKGRLLEIDPGQAACQACPAKGGCLLIGGLGKGYILTPQQP